MRILVDTNVIISGLIAKGACFEVLEDLVYTHTPIITPFVLAECQDVLLQKFHLSKPTVKSLLFVIERYFKQGENSTTFIKVCKDPDDNQLFADALLNKAEIILSGDKDVLSVKDYEGIRIISPKDYWKL